MMIVSFSIYTSLTQTWRSSRLSTTSPTSCAHSSRCRIPLRESIHGGRYGLSRWVILRLQSRRSQHISRQYVAPRRTMMGSRFSHVAPKGPWGTNQCTSRGLSMADPDLDLLQTALKRRWSRGPSQKAKPYVHAFSATERRGTKITAKVVGNHSTFTVSIPIEQGRRSACRCYIGSTAIATMVRHEPSRSCMIPAR